MQDYYENTDYQFEQGDLYGLRSYYIDYSNKLLGTYHSCEQPSLYLMDLVIDELKVASVNGNHKAEILLEEIQCINTIN